MEQTKQRWYWGLQLIGWTTCALAQLYALTSFGRFLPEPHALTYVLTVSLAGLVCTHAYRGLLLRFDLLGRPLSQQAGLAALALVGITLLIQAVAWLHSALTTHSWHAYSQRTFVVGILAMGRYLVIWLLTYHLFAAGQRLTRTELHQLRVQAALRQAQFETLRAQLNPHFLFNALNSIRALTLLDPDGARAAVTQLADLLRYTLQLEQWPLIPLHEELVAVRDYLALEQVRFGHRLRCRIAVPDEALAWLVPPVMVLTLVENAVKHGIAACPAGGTVSIDATLVAGALTLHVRQPGSLPPAGPAPGAGLGLANTRQRLLALYGPAATLDLREAPAGVVLATLHLPIAPVTR
ncbi:hypothetical protein E5K00_06440 [Hymenobacter aquaticus]|uniref:Signal transduction histidine kinase internal region domain-containing protein n=1 Tax=Hymenobacter aquaticus TaxID=1867101 RepID=A0A4Z0Q468_9BACT|nr:histidine kinase [Hymenobacter aquaticus]TGE24837.1 hypothetical protein E5K00_06440 [Hymenobacter aquaticus]